MDVDRAADVSVEARVEQALRIAQRRALGERELHDALVGLAGAYDAVVRPDRSAHPFPLLDDLRIRVVNELAHPAESLPAPVSEFPDSLVDQLGGVLRRKSLFHVLLQY